VNVVRPRGLAVLDGRSAAQRRLSVLSAFQRGARGSSAVRRVPRNHCGGARAARCPRRTGSAVTGAASSAVRSAASPAPMRSVQRLCVAPCGTVPPSAALCAAVDRPELYGSAKGEAAARRAARPGPSASPRDDNSAPLHAAGDAWHCAADGRPSCASAAAGTCSAPRRARHPRLSPRLKNVAGAPTHQRGGDQERAWTRTRHFRSFAVRNISNRCHPESAPNAHAPWRGDPVASCHRCGTVCSRAGTQTVGGRQVFPRAAGGAAPESASPRCNETLAETWACGTKGPLLVPGGSIAHATASLWRGATRTVTTCNVRFGASLHGSGRNDGPSRATARHKQAAGPSGLLRCRA
jgi:hypothetical protein